MKNNSLLTIIVSVLILAISIAFAGGQIHKGLTDFRSFDRSVNMKGLAEKDVMADLALWTIAYTETGSDLVSLQNLMDKRGESVIAFLKKYNIKEEEISLQQVQVQDLMAQTYRQNNLEDNRYILTQSYLVRTNDVESVSNASTKMGELVRQGVVFAPNVPTAPTYLYTKLNEIKPEMIAEATVNAKEAAKEFAANSG